MGNNGFGNKMLLLKVVTLSCALLGRETSRLMCEIKVEINSLSAYGVAERSDILVACF